MGTPYLAEIKLISWNYAPRGWAFCNGQLLPINQNQALFSLLGTSFGGDGRVTFALPDFRGRAPMHAGGTFVVGQQGGEEHHTLISSEMPAHVHSAPLASSVRANLDDPTPTPPGPPANSIAWAADQSVNRYSTGAPNSQLSPLAYAPAGGSQAHNNMQPYLVLNFIIALQGVFPSRN